MSQAGLPSYFSLGNNCRTTYRPAKRDHRHPSGMRQGNIRITRALKIDRVPHVGLEVLGHTHFLSVNSYPVPPPAMTGEIV